MEDKVLYVVIDSELHQWAKVEAARRGDSISALVRELLRARRDGNDKPSVDAVAPEKPKTVKKSKPPPAEYSPPSHPPNCPCNTCKG